MDTMCNDNKHNKRKRKHLRHPLSQSPQLLEGNKKKRTSSGSNVLHISCGKTLKHNNANIYFRWRLCKVVLPLPTGATSTPFFSCRMCRTENIRKYEHKTHDFQFLFVCNCHPLPRQHTPSWCYVIIFSAASDSKQQTFSYALMLVLSELGLWFPYVSSYGWLTIVIWSVFFILTVHVNHRQP